MALAAGFVGWSVYHTWTSGPWNLPAPAKASPSPFGTEPTTALAPRAPINTDVVVGRNLFDPERGAGATRDAEESSRSAQRVRNMILVGTVIFGNNRTAVLQDGTGTNAPAAPAQQETPMRLKLGDTVEGYRLAEIADKKVVFSKDGARIELLLDYFRKVEVAAPRPASPRQGVPGVAAPGPRVIPNLPRRGRVPVPGTPAPTS